MTEIETGKEVQLKNQNSYKGILFDVDKSTYTNTLVSENMVLHRGRNWQRILEIMW